MILDPFIILAVEGVTPAEMLAAHNRIYPDWQADEDALAWFEQWLKKLAKKPGLALSTGRRNSDRGTATCALLDVLKVKFPKGARTRLCLAWTIIASPVGAAKIGHVPELEETKANCATYASIAQAQ